MGNFIGNSMDYNIHAENEVAEILSHFNDDFIQTFISNKINQRFDYNLAIAPVNVVTSLEQNFKHILDCYKESQPEIWETRNNVYTGIINQIIKTFNLSIIPTYDSASGWYTEASLLYDFFVGNFLNKAIDFFSNEVLNNIDAIYKYINTEDRKDATVYAKKIYADNKLGILLNNMDQTMNIICGFDYDINDIFESVYTKMDYDILESFIRDLGDFYKNFYVSMFNSNVHALVFTEIRLAIHSKYMAANVNNQESILQSMEVK